MDHERGPFEDKSASLHSWLEVESSIIATELDPTEALSESSPTSQPENDKIPPYLTFYRLEDAVITKADSKFVVALHKNRRQQVVDDNFDKRKMGAWWQMRLYLGKEKAPSL